MRVVSSSPRRRRRLFGLGVVLAVVGAAVLLAVLLPNRAPKEAAPARNAPPAEVVKQSKYVSPADRREIDSTLDRFIPAALDRRSPETAWSLAGPGLRGGSTLRQWRQGTSSVPYYPARGKTFHNWTTIDAGPDYVDFNLLVHPRKGIHKGAYVFSGSMVKRGGRWLVNGLYTIAIFAAPTKSGRHEVGPADFAAGPAQSSNQAGPPQTSGGNRLGDTWLLAAGGVVVLALLFPLGIGIASVLRSRRNRKLYAASAPQTLPPLPSRYRAPSQHTGSASTGGQPH
jgi:hypothetical protein